MNKQLEDILHLYRENLAHYDSLGDAPLAKYEEVSAKIDGIAIEAIQVLLNKELIDMLDKIEYFAADEPITLTNLSHHIFIERSRLQKGAEDGHNPGAIKSKKDV